MTPEAIQVVSTEEFQIAMLGIGTLLKIQVSLSLIALYPVLRGLVDKCFKL